MLNRIWCAIRRHPLDYYSAVPIWGCSCGQSTERDIGWCALSPVLTKQARAWIDGDMTSEDYFDWLVGR